MQAALALLGLVRRARGEGRPYLLASKATNALEVLHAAASDAGAREGCGAFWSPIRAMGGAG